MPVIRLHDCVIKNPDPQNPTPDFNANQMTDVEQRIAKLAQVINQSSTTAPDNVLARQQLWANMTRMSELSSAHALSPRRASAFSSFIVRNLGMVQHALGFGDEYTDLGWVRASQIKARRLNAAEFRRQLREMSTSQAMADAWREFNARLAQKGIRSNAERRYIAAQVQELGWFPHIKHVAGTNPVGVARMREKFDLFRSELITRWQFTPQGADELLELGATSARVYHDIGELAHRVGVNVDLIEQLGYMPRLMSDEARRLLNWRWDDIKQGVLTGVDGSNYTVSAALMRGRSTYEFTANDEVVLDYVLRNFSRIQYGDSQHLYDTATGVQGAGIADVLDDHRSMIESLRNMIDLRPDLVNALVDAGILSKVPFTSVEVVDYLKNSLRLPFEGLSDVFESDWVRGHKLYTEQLEQLTRQSGQVQLIVRNSLDNNWGVSSAARAANPEMYKDWIPFLSNDPRIPAVFTPELLERYMFTQGAVRGDKVLAQIYDTYIHPDVAQIIRSTLSISNSPGALAVLGRGIAQLNRLFGSLALADPTYIPRQLIGAFFQLGAGGGDLNRLVPDLTRLVLSQLGLGTNTFDNSRKIYGGMTELELFNKAQDLGYIDRFEPLTGTSVDPTKYHAWNPLSVRKNARYMAYTLREHGLGSVVGEVLRGLGTAADRASFGSRWANNVIDNAARFSALKSSLHRTNREFVLSDITRFLTSGGTQKFNTVEEAIEHWQHYFFFYDDQTPADRFMRHFVPFWGFWGKMVPSAIRHVVRHPTRFMAYTRLYAILHGNEYESGDFTESSVPTWIQHSSPVYVRTPNGRGGFEHHAIPMEPFDPYQAAFGLIGGATSGVLDLFGIEDHNRSTAEKLGDRPWAEGTTSRLIQEYLDITWPIHRAIMSELGGVDIETKQDLDDEISFVGVGMTRRSRMWLSAIVPALNSVNSYNPGGMFGTREARDSTTGEVTPPEASIFGAARSDYDSFNRNNRYGQYRWVGIKIYPVDIAFNAGTTYDQLRIDVSNGRKEVQRLRERALAQPPGERERLLEQAEQVNYIIEETRVQLDALEAWAQDRNISITEASVRLRSYNRAIGDLPRP